MQTQYHSIAEPNTHHAQRPPLENRLQWGSDPSFQYHGFSCPIGNWTEERLVRGMMRNVAFMCRSINIDVNTNLEPPGQIKRPEPVPEDWSFLDGLEIPSPNISASASSLDAPLPGLDLNRKAKSTTPESTTSSSMCGSQKRKSLSPPDASSPKKRKCVQKPGQGLCHCRTEKRRREAIGRGYERLSQTVPALRGQSFTRKYILEGAATYLEKLVDGNNALQRQLDEMKARDMSDFQEDSTTQ